MTNLKTKYAEFMWRLWAVIHLLLVVGHFFAFFTLAIGIFSGWVAWYIGLPCCSWIFYTIFARHPCPLTRFENNYREMCGRKRVSGWLGHYFLKLPKQILGLMPKEDPYEPGKSGISNTIVNDGRG